MKLQALALVPLQRLFSKNLASLKQFALDIPLYVPEGMKHQEIEAVLIRNVKYALNVEVVRVHEAAHYARHAKVETRVQSNVHHVLVSR